MIALIASFLLATNATPREIVSTCRRSIPANVELSGRLILRNRKGVSLAEHDYVLARRNGATALTIDGTPWQAKDDADRERPLLGTDVTWNDLSLSYLWWDDAAFDGERESESVQGQLCAVVLLRKGGCAVRVWIDRKTGALMQAEELKDGVPARRLWGTRLKKFGERWMANVLEVETLGAGHRTKITVEEMK